MNRSMPGTLSPDLRPGLILSGLLLFAAHGKAAPIAFTNETDYISALASGGYVWVHESFEDDAVWGPVRSTIAGGSLSAAAVTNLGVRWTANNDTSRVTTSSGAAITGDWGVYALPHGSYATGSGCMVPGACGDGLLGSAPQLIHGVAGWVRGFAGSKVALFLDGDLGTPVEFPEVCDPSGENCTDYGLLGGGYKFFGVIEPAGIASFEFREMEGTVGDQKYLWFDDFTVAFVNPPAPRIASVTTASHMATLALKGLAVHSSYTLECSASLSSSAWTAVEVFTASGSETNVSETISPDSTQRFYRLRSS